MAKEPRANLFYLMGIRWIAVVDVALSYFLGINAGPPYSFVALIFYCSVLTLYWNPIDTYLRKNSLSLSIFLFADLTIAGILLWLSGGEWKSPYYMYAFTSLFICAFYKNLRGGIIGTLYYCILFSLGFTINGTTLSEIIEMNGLVPLIFSYVSFIIIAASFGYPTHIIKSIDKTKKEIVQAEDRIDRTRKLIDVLNSWESLSNREVELLKSLSEGKTNKQIAREFYLSEQTIKNYLWRIYKKIDVDSRAEAILFFHSKVPDEKRIP